MTVGFGLTGRYHGELDPVVLLVCAAVVVFGLLLLWWASRHRRRDPDRGGSGFTPVASPPFPTVPLSFGDSPDPVERWLLGFAAPFAFDLDVRAWDLGLRSEAIGLAGERDEWRVRVEWIRGSAPGPTAGRALDAAALAWWYRVGVAAGHVDSFEVRAATQRIADEAREYATDWLVFGSLVTAAAAQRGVPVASPRSLVRPGGPWANAWPR